MILIKKIFSCIKLRIFITLIFDVDFDREKMNDLKRQKERLEEKIMEHYKRQDNQKK